MATSTNTEGSALLRRLNANSGGIAKSYDRGVISYGTSLVATIPADRSMVARELEAKDDLRVHVLRDGRVVLEDPRVHTDLAELVEDD